MLRILSAGVCALALTAGVATAVTVEEISFESGSIGAFGAPAASGWQAEQLNTQASIDTVLTGRQGTFVNGTNDEALLINPYIQDASPNGFQQGATWALSDDADANQTAEVVEPGEVVYLISEIFSDVSIGNQEIKTGLAVGFAGNGGGFLGFDNAPGVDQSLQTQSTWGDNGGDAGAVRQRTMGTDRGGRFSNTRYVGPAVRSDLDTSQVVIGLYRQGADSPEGRKFVGTENEWSDRLGTFNGVDSSNLNVGNDPDMIWGGNEREMGGLILDRAQVHVLRGQGLVVPGGTTLSNHVDEVIPEDAQIGIKYVRFGTTSLTDFDLDDATTASGDGAVLLANIGTAGGGNPQGDKTFFDGDANNDQRVTAAADGGLLLSNLAPAELLRQVAEKVTDPSSKVDRRDLCDELLHMISCKAAIKAGDPLTVEEISALLRRRHLCQDAHHCPHGRPTALVFSQQELDRRFKRI